MAKEKQTQEMKLHMPDQKALGFKNEIFGNCKQTEQLSIISPLCDIKN